MPPVVQVTRITVSPTTLSLTVGETATPTVTVLPANATNKSYTKTSSNTAVATIKSTGVITAVSTGTATITYRTTNNKTCTCVVTVSAPSVTKKILISKHLCQGSPLIGRTIVDDIDDYQFPIPFETAVLYDIDGNTLQTIQLRNNSGYPFETDIEIDVDDVSELGAIGLTADTISGVIEPTDVNYNAILTDVDRSQSYGKPTAENLQSALETVDSVVLVPECGILVSFNANGGVPEPTGISVYGIDTCTATIPIIANPSKAGYRFDYWYYIGDENTIYPVDLSTPIVVSNHHNESRVYTAHWSVPAIGGYIDI